MGLTQTKLAERMGVHVQQVNAIARDRQAVTARTAVMLARALGTTPEFWMNLQVARDLWFALQERGARRMAN